LNRLLGLSDVGIIAQSEQGIADEQDPDKPSRKALARAAVDALAVMTNEAASRPDPRKELGARARRWTEQLRDR
jgi:hypothetical protein